MGKEEITPYVRCRTCGRYVEKAETYNEQFCSPECSTKRRYCMTCGRFFAAGDSDYDEFCSQECYEGYHTPLREVDIPHTEGEEL